MLQILDIIRPVASADFEREVYYYVYASANTTVTLNGESVTLVAGTTLPILVKTITGGSGNVYLLGTFKPTNTMNTTSARG